ncbi:acyltransferase family protein [Paraferrimonas sp. SM1919]|uniref:acyltransferase family protein n=1 Tax=Paraferrimonas sp. SM1919 TaxID=2662263 RepID=UPI0013D0FBE3|nr:acyltransferase family protein [Paraferrimonas sp. SM1919]
MFRYDLNSLRAVAVISVVLFHFFPDKISGGFAGVDIFFVISGYLMTSIISKRLAMSEFSFFGFYLSRVNRILPPLLVLCFVLLIFGWFYLIPVEYKSLGKHLSSSSIFLSNYIYLMESGYFEQSAFQKWLLHTWSLSLEWQFYLIYPILLIALYNFNDENRVKYYLLFFTLFLFVANIYVSFHSPTYSYFTFLGRMWEMLLGSVIFFFPIRLKHFSQRFYQYLGLFIVISSFFIFSKEDYWPSYNAAYPLLGVYILLSSNANNTFFSKSKTLQFFGNISYSLYLWHWPVLVFVYFYDIDLLFPALLVSFMISICSYYLVEQQKIIKGYSLFLASLVFTGFVFTMSSLVWLNSGFNSDVRPVSASVQSKFLNEQQAIKDGLGPFYWLKCNSYSALENNDETYVDESCFGDVGGIFLWGDSHAEALSYGLRLMSEEHGLQFHQKTSAGCIASFDETVLQRGNFKKACDASNKIAISRIEKLKPDLVIITQSADHDKIDYSVLHNKIIELGAKRVLFIGPVPHWTPSLPRVLVKPKHWESSESYLTDPGLLKSIFEQDAIAKNKAASSDVNYISLLDSLCYAKKGKNFCLARLDGGILQIDYGHLSPLGSVYIVENILKKELLISQLINK